MLSHQKGQSFLVKEMLIKLLNHQNDQFESKGDAMEAASAAR